MKSFLSISALLLSGSAIADTYADALNTLATAPAEVKAVMDNAPATYTFNSQFVRSSSVSYTGQTFRQVLLSDLKSAMTSNLSGGYNGTVEEAKNMLMSYYAYNEKNDSTAPGVIYELSEFKVGAVNLDGRTVPIKEGFFYSDIQSPGKNLVSKIAGNDNPLRRGKVHSWKGTFTPDQLVNNWFDAYANNAVNGQSFTVPNGSLAAQTITGAHITKDGLDYAQLTQKFLFGAVSYSQAARDYFSTDLGPTKGLNADNTKPAKQGASYTAMEHHFDEGFGYYGAARDALKYTDLQTRQKLSRDTNGDGFISLKSEKNFYAGVNAARLDVTAADGKVTLSEDAMNAFLKGRELIVKKPTDYKKYVVAQAQVALGAWEKSIAGVTIHYINKTLKEYQEYGTASYLFTDFVKFWGEMKGYAMGFEFNPHGMMSDATFDQLHALMADKPVLPHASETEVKAYMDKLLQARDLLGKTYNFSDENVANW